MLSPHPCHPWKSADHRLSLRQRCLPYRHERHPGREPALPSKSRRPHPRCPAAGSPPQPLASRKIHRLRRAAQATPRLLHPHGTRPRPCRHRGHPPAPHPPRLRRPAAQVRDRMMKIYRQLADVPSVFEPCIATIGNFDGVPRGHQWVIAEVVARAHALGIRSIAVTFDPHPARIIRPAFNQPLITPLAQKLALLETTGIDALLVLPFTRDRKSTRLNSSHT